MRRKIVYLFDLLYYYLYKLGRILRNGDSAERAADAITIVAFANFGYWCGIFNRYFPHIIPGSGPASYYFFGGFGAICFFGCNYYFMWSGRYKRILANKEVYERSRYGKLLPVVWFGSFFVSSAAIVYVYGGFHLIAERWF